jgi:hypothetical protein
VEKTEIKEILPGHNLHHKAITVEILSKMNSQIMTKKYKHNNMRKQI